MRDADMVRHATTESRTGSPGLKIGALAVYAALFTALAAAPVISSAVARQPQQQSTGRVIELNTFGPRGWVAFNHDNHVSRPNPDPNAPFKTTKGASCSGCHHTLDQVTGSPQLWKCTACHRGSGDPKNPKGRDGDEQWSETAFHNLCITCHISSAKGPTKCGDCHQLRSAVGRVMFRSSEFKL